MTTRVNEARLVGTEALPPLEATPPRLAHPSVPARARRRGWLIRRFLLASDVLALCIALAVAERVVDDSVVDTGQAHWVFYFAAGLLVLAALAVHGLYGRDEFRADHTTTDDLPAIFNSITVAAFLMLGGLVLADVSAPKLPIVAWGASLVTVPALRAGARFVARRRREYVQNTIVVGGGQIGQLMARKLLTHPEYGLRLVGLVDDDPRPLRKDVEAVRVLGGPEQIERIVARNKVERAIVAFSTQTHEEELELIRQLRDLDLQVDVVPRLFEVVGPSAGLNVFEGLSVVALPPRRISRGRLAIKRALDIVLSSLAIVAVLPFAVLIALAIVLDDRGGLLYRGERIGPGGRRFKQLKFRTMAHGWTPERFDQWLEEHPVEAADFASTQKLAEDPRVTRVGRWLRRTSLDELPQLLNVLKGDLSLVGPRPITELEQRSRYRREAIHPHSEEALLLGYWDVEGLRPGLTGYWQISGRSKMSFEERIRLDTAYLTNWSLSLDFAILLRTLRALFATRGAF